MTSESSRAFANQYLQVNTRVVAHAVPGKQVLPAEVPKPVIPSGEAGGAAMPANADEPWRATAPLPSAARPVRLPTPESFQLPNGLTVLVSPQPGMPVVSATLVVRNGGDANPIDKPGLAGFSAAMLTQGTTSRSAMRLAEDAAEIGASLEAESSMDAMQVTASSLSRHFPAALDLLADVVRNPTFPDEEIERVRALRSADLVQQRSSATQIANSVAAAALYGLEHPYGFSDLGTLTAIKAITRDQLHAFWRQHFVPGNAALVVAGAITAPEVRRLAESEFGAWPRGETTAPKLGESALGRPKLVLVDRPGSPQTQLRVATVGVARSNPDYMRIRVMNTILGGLFSSRVNLNLREAHGYTYGARSEFSYWRGPGPFWIRTGVRTDVTAPAVREIFTEVKRIISTPVSGEELALAKAAITRSLPGQFETNAVATGAFASLFVYGLPFDYYATLPAKIEAVTAQDVQTAAAKYLSPEALMVVAVGDGTQIRQPLEEELGPAQLRNADGQLLAK